MAKNEAKKTKKEKKINEQKIEVSIIEEAKDEDGTEGK